ncbi:unnamed protein product [Linum trigynum]
MFPSKLKVYWGLIDLHQRPQSCKPSSIYSHHYYYSYSDSPIPVDAADTTSSPAVGSESIEKTRPRERILRVVNLADDAQFQDLMRIVRERVRAIRGLRRELGLGSGLAPEVGGREGVSVVWAFAGRMSDGAAPLALPLSAARLAHLFWATGLLVRRREGD